MLKFILAVSAILLVALIYFTFIVKPKQLIRYYKKSFEQNDFKVFDYEFSPFQYAELEKGMKAQEKSRDAMSITKEVASEFDVSITNLVQKVQLNLISPKLMRAFFEADQEKYYDKDEFFVGGLRRTFGNGITLASGNAWKHKRRIVTKMLNFSYIKLLVPKIEAIIERKTSEHLRELKIQQNNQFHEIDLLELTTIIASTVVLQLFFGGSQFNVNEMKINNTKMNHYVRHLFELLLRQLMSPLTIILGTRFTKLGIRKNDKELNDSIKEFHNYVLEFVNKRLKELEAIYKDQSTIPEVYTDLIEAFYCEEIIKSSLKVTPEFIDELTNDFGQLYAAGTDTTAHNTQVALYYVISHPQVLSKLRKQIAENIKDIRNLSYEDFKSCHYLEAVVMESLRMYSSANGIFPRVAKEDNFLKVDNNTILIKKGTIVNTQTFSIHYKSTVYEEPNRFKPERFIDGEGKIISPEPYTWMNFSAGFRSCVGKQLALTQMKTILITLLSLYDFKCDDSNKLLYFKQFAYNLANVKFEMKGRSANCERFD